MSKSGGRRIKRALLIDQTSVRFLEPEERARMRRFALIDGYLDNKQAELAEYNAKLEASGKDQVNNRRATNLGTFRAYVARSEERRVGKECVSPCRSRGTPCH